MAALIAKILFMLFSVIALRYGLKISEYEAYWLAGFLLINSWVRQEVIILISFKNLPNKCKEKLVILQAIGIIVIKQGETRAVIYTCRYSSGQFNLHYNICRCRWLPLFHLFFIAVIPIDCKITNFSLHSFVYFFNIKFWWTHKRH